MASKTADGNKRFAQAEALLVLALLGDSVVQPWLFARPELPVWGKTLVKMALIVGLFGPVNRFLNHVIDRSLSTTRNLTENVLWLPRLVFHVLALALLFVLFHTTMHGALPWATNQERVGTQTDTRTTR